MIAGGTVRTLFVRFGADLSNFNKGAGAVDKRVDAMAKRFTAAGKTLTKGLTLPLLGLGIAAGKLSIDFETSMAKIVGLVGVAQEQVSEWGDEILALAPSLGKAPAELADAMFFITSAGLRGAEAMDVLVMSAKASAAGLGETKIVADLVTSAVNAYGIENLSAAKATDILVGAVREGKAEAPELVSALGKVLPVATEMGVRFDQVGAAIAAMTRTGTDAATAGTQLSAILSGLLKPSEQASDALMAMGTSAAKLRRQMLEGDLLGALMKIRELTGVHGEEFMAQVFPNIRALRGILDLMGANMEENIGIFRRMEKAAEEVSERTARRWERMGKATGLTDAAFQAMAETAGFLLKQALMEVQTLLVHLGDAILPVVIPLIQKGAAAIKRFAEWFKALTDEQKENVVKWGLFIAALGPALIAIGAVGSAIAFLITPVGLVIVAIGALVAAGVWLWQNWDKVTAWLGEAWQKVSGWIAESIAGIVEDVMWLIDKIKLVLDWLDRLPKGTAVYEAAPTSASARVAGGGVPGMAAGGHVTGSGWADVGEHGRERLFLPRGATVVPLAAGSGRGGGDVTLNNVFNIHASTAAIGKQTAQEAADALWRRFREAGTL